MSWIPASDLQLKLNEETGNIDVFSIQGETLRTKPASGLPLLELTLLDGERRIGIIPRVSGVENVDQGGRVSFSHCVSALDESVVWPIRGTCTVSVDETGTVHWQLSLDNGAELSICEALFPRLTPLYLSERAELVYPHHAGEKVVDVPRALASEKYQKFWRAESVATDFGYAREINYCGLASMTWMDIYDGSLGLYVASYDPTFPVTGLRVETGGPEDPWVSLSFRKYLDIHPGESYRSPEVVWAFHRGDWHQGAHKYRAWFDTVVKQETHPVDLKDEIVLSPHYDFRRFDGIGYRFADIPAIADSDREEFGSRHFFMAGWNHMGFDSHYPNYNPDLELGTPLRLQQGVEYVNESGGFVTFYINARIMDKYSEYVSTLGENWMLRTTEQKPIFEIYGPAETFVLCPSNPEWREHLADFAVWMCQAYNARGIYYDQLGSATPYPCYSHHVHDQPGTTGFNLGYIDLIERTTERLRAIRPDSFLMIENCGDVYSSKVWGSLAWNGEFYDEFFNLYKYTFPEQTLINMVNPRGIADPGEQERVFYNDLARAFVLGSVIWVEGGAFRKRIGDKEQLDRMLNTLYAVLDVRRSINAELHDALFQDDLGLTLPPGMFGSRWDSKTGGGGLLLLANPHGVTGDICLHVDDCEAVELRTLDSMDKTWQEPIQLVLQDGKVAFAPPKGAYSAVLWRTRKEG